MKEFIEKLKSKIGTLQRYYYYGVKDLVRVGEVEKIAEQLAEEYKREVDNTDYANIELYAFWQKHQWIPCSERLPEKAETVIVTYEDRFFGSNHMGVCAGQFLPLADKGWEIEDYGNADNFKVIAWQPLPEPYQPQEEDS